uniref:Uncharacterized protein n=1 Tax=Euplotes crassus TaxID=5936 RepID=A0A7S3KR25_EUPCR|mmetsp:Transcript_3832/g.3572  ORF Transcript_3832/g.3572 Transcript_3832/m.3572 type:complete len:168 (+) Transcript_3832:834-1337(+)|eukprot:CAMPEP_0197002568 /NCGR_PEP_ID=MMETSP1380-20130617/7033_1 /TAXON_ID=5936 /ORGANISM="Euplotes crassus, Strain CT5" /LENGTH=167 /DNA_ID=CAMNT_0042420751 /DNA_START=833 /DNA_END=1336 /DNA_ORIENTATION=-
MPTSADIADEFSRRKTKLDEEMTSQIVEDIPEVDFDRSLFENKSVMRGIGYSDEEEKMPCQREEQEYDAGFENYHKFFSTTPIEDLWDVLCEYITMQTDTYKFSADVFCIFGEVMGKEFLVNILKVPDQDKHCIDGILLKGNKFEFTDIFRDLKKFFGGHANAALSD